MTVLLVAGIICFALCGLELARTLFAPARERHAALESVRTLGQVRPRESGSSTLGLLRRLPALLARIHTTIWRKQSADDVGVQLLQAGVPRRVTPELFMALRVALTGGGLIAGFTLAHGAGRFLFAFLLAFAGIYFPAFALSKIAAARADRIGAELPHFIDQLGIAIEAGMSFDAALNYLLQATDGPIADEMGRVLTELRVGESRRNAMRNFAERVGSEDATAFANAVLASDQLGSPLSGILHAQAGDFRHRRQTSAEERAQKAPVKMLFPIVIFILPVMFVVILAPAFLGSHGIL